MLFRLVRVIQKLRVRRSIGFGFVVAMLAIAVLGNAFCFLLFEGESRPELTTEDALWYSVISVTTIGYGDFFPTTTGARISTIVFIVVIGLSAFTLFFGMAVEAVTAFVMRGQKGMTKIVSTGHVLVVNFPGVARVRQILDELHSDPEHRKRDVVLVTDQIERLPPTLENVFFVFGSPLEAETYERAGAAGAEMAIVLATSYQDANSDAIVTSAISVMSSFNAGLHIVAECVDERHLCLFRQVNASAVISGLRIASNLLVQEGHDPGVTRLIDVITSNQRGQTLYTAAIGAGAVADYAEAAKRLLDHDINVLAVVRGDTAITCLRGEASRDGDRIVYIGSQRLDGEELIAIGSS